MMLRCKILPKYLDDILNGRKDIEYREIEGIEFNDGTRTVVLNVLDIEVLDDEKAEFLSDNFPDVKWGKKMKVKIILGNKVKVIQ